MFTNMFPKIINPLHYDKICRTCLNTAENLVPLIRTEILNMLSICIAISIKENDGFPQQICSNCFQKATDSYNFNQQCLNADQILKENCFKYQSNTLCENDESNKSFDSVKDENVSSDNNDSSSTSKLNVIEKQGADCCGSNEVESKVNDLLDFDRDIKRESESAWEKAISFGSDKCDPTTNTCKICDKVLSNVHSLVRHIQTHEKNRKFVAVCPVCNKGFYKKRYLNNHLLRHKGETKFSCKECKKQFYELCTMRLHCKRKHADKKVFCSECDQTFFLEQDLEVHKKIHNKEQHACPDCGKTFRFRFRLKNHQWMHAKERTFHCKQCDKSFKSKRVLKLHYKRVHSGERKREVCNVCGKAVVCLKTHRIIHNNEKYKCTSCGQEFKNKYSLETHTKRKHSNIDEATLNPYLCNICGRRSANLRMLNRHFLSHTDVRPYQCHICSKFFKRADRRNNHIKYTHNNVRDYKCSFCSKGFHTKSALTRHIRVHTGERPYNCKLCGKSFQQQSTLKTHMKVHGLHTKNGDDQITENIEVNLPSVKIE